MSHNTATRDTTSNRLPTEQPGGRDWFSMSKAQRRNVDPTSDYVPSDDQLTETVGPHMAQYTNPAEDGRDPVEQAVPQETVNAVLDAIDRPRKVAEQYIRSSDHSRKIALGREPEEADRLPKHDDGVPLPGFGTEYDDCDDDLPMFCECCGNDVVVGRTCKRSECPRCGAAWVRDRTVSFASRLAVARAVRDANRDPQQYYHHLAWIPPEDWALQAENTYAKTIEVIKEIMDAMDIGGYIFYHPWSGDNPDGEDDRGKWRDRLFQGRDWGDVRAELKFRPHFHIIAVGGKVPGQNLSTEVYEKTGWILNRITKGDSNVSLYDNNDLVAATSYSVSHTALKTINGSNYLQYDRHGPILRKVTDTDDPDTLDIPEHRRREIDVLTREHAEMTLGIDLNDQLCGEQVLEDTARNGLAEATTYISYKSGGDTREMTGDTSGGDGGGGGGGGPDDTDPSVSEFQQGGSHTEVEEVDGTDRPETTDCKGRLIHVKNAPDYLEDDDWCESAACVHSLEALWNEWKDRLDELGVES